MHIRVHTVYIHVHRSMSVFDNSLPDDLLRELVFFNTFEELNLPIKPDQVTHGGRGSGQAVRTTPNTVSVRGSSREHGGQSPPHAAIPGWKCNSDNPSPVQ